MKITITMSKKDRKTHCFSKDCKISTDQACSKTDMLFLKHFILNSINEWYDEYENQPTASQLHPL